LERDEKYLSVEIFRRRHLEMRKKWFLYPLANIKNRFLFGSYGKDVYIEPGVVINRPRYIHIGDRTFIKQHTNINIHPADKKSKEGMLFLGKHVTISQGCIISAFKRIVLEDGVGMAPYGCILDNTRNPADMTRPFQEQDVEVGSVHIGEGSWLGYNVCVLPNVTIGKHCIIGALSLVKKDIPPYCIAVGCPAKVVKRYDFDRGKWVKADERGNFLE
jgi:acetyltransferase-like isoleucine patch superfamily enzyme